MNSLDNITAGPVKATMKDAGASSSDLWNVPVAAIRIMEGFNVRVHNTDYAAHICEIGESILANGFMKDKPLSGFVANEGGQNIIYVTDGHSRLEAVAYANERGAQITTVPVVTKPAGTGIEDLTIGLVTSNSGKPLTPIEKAAVVKRLVGYGMEEAVIAKRLGFTVGYVGDLLKLIAAPKKIRAMVESGEVSASNGANVDELPKNPMSTPCDSANSQMLGDMPANTKPLPTPKAPIHSGTCTPHLSANLPMTKPPAPKPNIIKV